MGDPLLFPTKVPFSSKCMVAKAFVPGEVRNQIVSDMIQYMFDTYCEGKPPIYSGWQSTDEEVTSNGCKEGEKRLVANLLFREDASIFCPATQTGYKSNGVAMMSVASDLPFPSFDRGGMAIRGTDAIAEHELVVNKNRSYSMTYVYRDKETLALKKLTLPTDVDRKEDIKLELILLNNLLSIYHDRGYPTADVIEALKYISIQPGRFDGIAFVSGDFLAILEIKTETARLSEKEKAYFVKKLHELPLVGAKGEKIPSFARYYYAYRSFSELGTLKRNIMRRSN